MPKENKKRGRRTEAQKRKHDDADVEEQHGLHATKRRKPLDEEESTLWLLDQPAPSFNNSVNDNQHAETAFYGLLDEQEQEYFKGADGILELNQFQDPEERSLFLQNVYKEADGKELKLACSQSCSRLLERLILLSNPHQLKSLFGKFSGHFLNLVQHRFASHCCETLFIQSAPVVTQELLEPTIEDDFNSASDGQPVVSMENLFLHTINEMLGNLGYLMTDRFASHALRILLVILSGQKLDLDSGNSVLNSKKKEHVDVVGGKGSERVTLEARTVPQAFSSALKKLINESIAGLDTHYLRTLATHQVGNPMLQLLIQLELTHLGKQRARDNNSVIRILLPDDPITEGTESASFINSLIYDSVGSRLLETIIENAPGKIFKIMYKELFKDRMGSLARNEIASYVVSKIIERLSREDLDAAVNLILPQIPNLAKRGRTAVIKTMIERCAIRGVDTTSLATAIRQAYSDDGGESLSISKLLSLPPDAVTPAAGLQQQPTVFSGSAISEAADSSSTDRSYTASGARPSHTASSQSLKHASMLTQSMIGCEGPLSEALFSALSTLPAHLCVYMAMSSTLSPILQTALTVPHSPLIFRRKLITRFYSHIRNLSLDPSGSHVVDAIWRGTQGMAFARERVAEELAENESALRESFCGRKVWRNWNMDLYRRRRSEWVRTTRESVGNDGFLSFPSGAGSSTGSSRTDANRNHEKSREARLADNDSSAPHGVNTLPSDGRGPSVFGGISNANANAKSKLDLARERHAKSRGYSFPSKSGIGATKRIEGRV